MKKAPAKTTKPKEFSLTKPKPAVVPVPDLIPLQEKCKPVRVHVENSAVFTSRGLMQTFQGRNILQVPVCTYKPPKEIQKIEEIKKKNRQRTKVFLYNRNTIYMVLYMNRCEIWTIIYSEEAVIFIMSSHHMMTVFLLNDTNFHDTYFPVSFTGTAH